MKKSEGVFLADKAVENKIPPVLHPIVRAQGQG